MWLPKPLWTRPQNIITHPLLNCLVLLLSGFGIFDNETRNLYTTKKIWLDISQTFEWIWPPFLFNHHLCILEKEEFTQNTYHFSARNDCWKLRIYEYPTQIHPCYFVIFLVWHTKTESPIDTKIKHWIWIDDSLLQFREIQKVAFKLQNPIQKIQKHRWTQKLTSKILVFDYSFQRISQETCQWHSFIVQWCHFFESHNTKKVWWLLYLLSIPYTTKHRYCG